LGNNLLFCFDYAEPPAAWHESTDLLMEEVKSRVAYLGPE